MAAAAVAAAILGSVAPSAPQQCTPQLHLPEGAVGEAGAGRTEAVARGAGDRRPVPRAAVGYGGAWRLGLAAGYGEGEDEGEGEAHFCFASAGSGARVG